MGDEERAPGADGLHLAAGLGLLRPEGQAFTAMLDGWAAQQLARRPAPGTVAARQRAVRAFAAHVQAFPWGVSPCSLSSGCDWSRRLGEVAPGGGAVGR